MSEKTIIVWLRRDLRLEDNPALHAAREAGAAVLPLFVLEEDKEIAPGGAARWWLHHSLRSLEQSLEKAGAPLILRRGEAGGQIAALVAETGAGAVYWNRRYAPWERAIDKALKETLEERGVEARSFSGNLLREPWETESKSGGPYRVFTPFWKQVSRLGPSREARPALRKIEGPERTPSSDKLDDWNLTPSKPDWAASFGDVWSPGEQGARDRLNGFLGEAISHYAKERDMPGKESTSRLSPHFAFGEISPLTIWNAVQAKIESGDVDRKSAETFLSEVGWREFSYSLLYHNDGLRDRPLREEFADFPWRKDKDGVRAWKEGLTGYPIVDAGMRQLWKTGWMHNRVRMITASFLIKDLLIPWQEGERWFRDTLVDADAANNAAGWQWVAGSGADASPYFRIFNPHGQGEKFDPQGKYIREFVPELAGLPDKYIHRPWEASDDVLKKAGVALGETYPRPIVDHAGARKRALEAYREIKGG